MRKILCIVTLCLVAPALAAAGDAELRFSWWGANNRHEGTLKCISLFEQANPAVKIKSEYTGFPGYLERMTLQISANTEPDFFQFNWAWLEMFSKGGDGFYDILKLKSFIDLGNYDQKWLDMTTINGKLNAIPISFTAQVFLLNKTTWDKAGLALPKTWDDFLAAGPVFKEKLGDSYYPFDALWNAHVYLINSYIFQKTGHMFIDPKTGDLGLTRAELVDAFTFYRRLIDSHAIVPLQLRANISGNMETAVNEIPDYLEGRWAGHYNWDGTLAVTAKDVGERFEMAVSDYPTQSGALNSGRVGRPNMVYAISKNTRYPETAAKAINFLVNSPEAAKILKVDRGVPLSKTALKACLDDKLVNAFNLKAREQLDAVDVHMPHPYLENPRVLQPLMDIVEQVSQGRTTIEGAADSIIRDIPRILARLKRGGE